MKPVIPYTFELDSIVPVNLMMVNCVLLRMTSFMWIQRYSVGNSANGAHGNWMKMAIGWNGASYQVNSSKLQFYAQYTLRDKLLCHQIKFYRKMTKIIEKFMNLIQITTESRKNYAFWPTPPTAMAQLNENQRDAHFSVARNTIEVRHVTRKIYPVLVVHSWAGLPIRLVKMAPLLATRELNDWNVCDSAYDICFYERFLT